MKYATEAACSMIGGGGSAVSWVSRPDRGSLIPESRLSSDPWIRYGCKIGFSAGQVAGVLINGSSYAYRIVKGDTPQSVAANLAALARLHSPIALSHSTLSATGARSLAARVVANATTQQEVRRQEQEFRITCWCPTPATRDTTANAIDHALSSIRFLPLQDGTAGRISYAGTTVFDQSQNARLYRRDLNYTIEYATILTTEFPSMLFGNLILNSSSTIA